MEFTDDQDTTLFPPPDKYTTILNNVKSKSTSISGEFEKLFIKSKMYPQNQEIQHNYENILTALKNIQTELLQTSNETETNVININNALLKINVLINKERTLNHKLKKQFKSINSEQNMTDELIDNYTEVYNIQYLKNWSLLLSSIFVIILIIRISKPVPVPLV